MDKTMKYKVSICESCINGSRVSMVNGEWVMNCLIGSYPVNNICAKYDPYFRFKSEEKQYHERRNW